MSATVCPHCGKIHPTYYRWIPSDPSFIAVTDDRGKVIRNGDSVRATHSDGITYRLEHSHVYPLAKDTCKPQQYHPAEDVHTGVGNEYCHDLINAWGDNARPAKKDARYNLPTVAQPFTLDNHTVLIPEVLELVKLHQALHDGVRDSKSRKPRDLNKVNLKRGEDSFDESSKDDMESKVTDAVKSTEVPANNEPHTHDNITNRLTIVEGIVQSHDNGISDLTKRVTALSDENCTLLSKIEDLEKRTPRVIEFKCNNAPPVKLDGMVHKNVPALVRKITALQSPHSKAPANIWLGGDAGGGKTTVAFQLAKILGLELHIIPPATFAEDVLGQTNPLTGKYITKPFRIGWERGGLLLIDELDRWGLGAINAMQAALANEVCAFNDGAIITRGGDGKNFTLVLGSANSMGNGSSTYSGLFQMDAATMSRFTFQPWPFDEDMELAISTNSPLPYRDTATTPHNSNPAEWVKLVQKVRVAYSKTPEVVISPRLSYIGAAMMQVSDMPRNEIAEAAFGNLMATDSWETKGTAVMQWVRGY